LIIAFKKALGCIIENGALDPPCAVPEKFDVPCVRFNTDVKVPPAVPVEDELMAFCPPLTLDANVTLLAIIAPLAIVPVGVYGGWLAVESAAVSAPAVMPSAREVKPLPAPATPSARPKVFGRVIRQLAAHAAAAVPWPALVVAEPVLVRIGAAVSDKLLNIFTNNAWFNALLLFDEPEVALPNVPSSNSSQPVSAVVLIVSLTSPVWATAASAAELLGFSNSHRVLPELYRSSTSWPD
jgi:hypothetical protein